MDTNLPQNKVNILTLNCWGIKYITPLRTERLAEIGRRIAEAEPTPDIIGLQECFSRDDFESIREQTRQILPYAKHYYAGPFGAGLAILSRWPLEETSMINYSLNGLPTAFFHGDWYAGKGVACATVRYGPAYDEVIYVFNTHRWNVVMEDNNAKGNTYGSPQNTWHWTRKQRSQYLKQHDENGAPAVPPDPDHSQAMRIDYILANTSTQNRPISGHGHGTWVVVAATLGMLERHPILGCSLSDHFSVEATLAIQEQLPPGLSQQQSSKSVLNPQWAEIIPARVSLEKPRPDSPMGGSKAQDSQSRPDTEMKKPKSVPEDDLQNPHRLSKMQVLDGILRTLRDYELVRRRRMQWRRLRLGGAGITLLGSLVGVWAIKHVAWARFLLALAGMVATGLLTIDGLGSYLFTQAETAALEELKWEVENEQKRI
ncbi:hypothetical protein FANTH_10169 [Fusarium anthophilum]|uniref:Endonuclease/exonuclease/phosphatase domain-containing protein n=1 Tax=Fusarium anthophilum TaxID=48485 RepID=A0A8H4Z2P9_9HYPO|nr:hypothetical protein FANTH_10169 [Fusarium anthophilum]